MQRRAGAMVLLASVATLAALSASAQLSGQALVSELQRGGYVIVMRHARSPVAPPDAAHADRANDNHERQFDDAGRSSASAMGRALRTLHLRLGTVWASPTYRARETVELAGFGPPKIAAQLGDHGRSMQGASNDQAAWLRAHANETRRLAPIP